MALLLPTTTIQDNEPCFELQELNIATLRPGAGIRRIQIIRVIRNDRICEFRRDLGPASKFKTEEFVLPGAVGTTDGHYDVMENVGRLVGAANEYRAKYDKPTQRRDPTNLVKLFEIDAIRRREARQGRVIISMGGRP